MPDDGTQRRGALQIDAMEFERFVLGLLRADAMASDRQFLVGPEAGPDYRNFDAIFPLGYGDLPGPTVVEVKYGFNRMSLDAFFSRAQKTETEYGSILLVGHAKGKELERARRFVTKRVGVPIRVMGRDEVQALAEKHPAMALTYDMRFLSDAIESFEVRDVSRHTQQHIGVLKSAFKEDQLVLFLGAGVSLSAGLPDWPNLLNRLTMDLLKSRPDIAESIEGSSELLEYFREESPSSPIIAARFLRDSMRKFAECVRRALYKSYDGTSHSELIQAIGKLCMPERARQGLLAVVNYNFDDLIGNELQQRNVNYHVVIGEEDSPSRDELPIYHPHGFLPSKGPVTKAHEAALVLSEDAYHSQFIDPYSWANITQLNLLRNHVCLFLGLSMTDPNLRRLLEISQRKKPGARHYVVLKDHWQPSGKRVSKSITLVSKVFRGLEETSFVRLGVSVIWIKDYGDIPKVVAQIKE